MSIIGNLIFSPFLMVFLIISSLIFFTQIFCIPNHFLIISLEKTTILWQKLLELGKKEWLCPFTKQNPYILILIPLTTFWLLSFKKVNSIQKRIAILSGILIFSLTTFSYNSYNLNTQKIHTLHLDQKSKNRLIIKKEKNKIEIEDFGFFNRKKSISKFIEFELRPYFIKNFGTLNIKNLKIANPGIASFKATEEFCNKFTLEKVTLPIFDKKLTKYGWKCFFDMKRKLLKNNVLFIRQKQ